MEPVGSPHHVGVACRDIEAARSFVHATHRVVADSGVIHDPRQHADLCLLQPADGPAIELVSGEAVADLLGRGHAYYHLCYEVRDLDGAIAELKGKRCRPVSEPLPAVLFDGRRVCFLLSPLGLVELLEAA